MTRAKRGRSLFWTIAGLFLLTVVLGTLVQTLMAVAVLRPLEARDARGRAEIVASSIAVEIAARERSPSAAVLDTLLGRYRAELGPRPVGLVYRASDGSVVTAPPERARYIRQVLGGKAVPDSLPDGPAPGEPPFRLELMARRTVVSGSTVLGEILVVRPTRRHSVWDLLGRSTAVLFLPIAILTSALAGLVVVRLLVRRLRSLETLAARVTEGDLSVRIADHSGDEIGRLAERLDRMAERLAEARGQVEKTERQRRQLFADITHELATPLTSIRGYAETMLDPQVPLSGEERTRYVYGVLEESRRLDRLIRDLFDLARLEAGATPLAKEPLDWAALCRNTVERFEPRFADAGLRLVWRDPPDEAWIEADGRRIEQVLENLLINALRYVPAGGSVELSLAASPQRSGHFRLAVSDDGPGVAPEELPLVFERFYRGTAARAHGEERDAMGSGLGSGLGLAIVLEIVERHGGTVRAQAHAPHGLSIVIELPARA